MREASEEIKTRYKFLKGPFDNQTAGTAEAKYEHGAYKRADGREIHITGLVIHGDGFVIDAGSSTEDADAFLEEVFSWMASNYGTIPVKEAPVKRLYSSELNISLEKAPSFFNPKLKRFFDEISKALDDGKTGPTGFLGFQVITDPERSPRPAQFRFEREINTSIDGNRYYSYAPVQTSTHIKLLESLDAVL